MAISKIILNGVTQMDVTGDTVQADKLLSPYTATKNDGTQIEGSVAAKTSTDVTVSGDTVSIPAGMYSSAVSKAVASGTEGPPTATKGSVSNHSVSVTPSVTNGAGYISGGTHTGTAVTVTASELESGTKSISANGTNIDVTGYAAVDVAVPSSSPNLQNKTVSYTPTESAQSDTVSADSGYDGLSSVAVSVGAISDTYVGSGITRRTSSDVTIDVSQGEMRTNVPSGYYASSVTKYHGNSTISPSAAKGTVSNHSVDVTPSVSYTAGSIPISGSKNGTAVTVTASELVSGSETKNANGTYDVTNLASLVVAVPIVTYYTGSSTPSSSLGSNGDIYLQTS